MKVDKSKWEKVRLGDVCEEISAGGDKPLGYTKERTKENIYPMYANGKEKDGLYGYCSEAKIRQDCLTVSGRGTIGYAVIHREPFTPIVRLIVAVPKKELTLDYFKYAINITSFESTGNTIPQLTVPLFKKHYIPLPPLCEQRVIAEELDGIQGMIGKCREQLEDYDRLAQSCFHEMFGDPVRNEKGWEIKKLGDVCSFHQGVQVDIENQENECKDGYVRFIRIIDVTQGTEPYRYIKKPSEHCIIAKNEVAMVRYGNVGFVCHGFEGAIANNLFKILPRQHNIFKDTFLAYYLKSNFFQKFIQQGQCGVALKAISFRIISPIPIPLPPVPLQEQFASRIEAIERMKEAEKAQLADLQQLFDSRMQYYFS